MRAVPIPSPVPVTATGRACRDRRSYGAISDRPLLIPVCGSICGMDTGAPGPGVSNDQRCRHRTPSVRGLTRSADFWSSDTPSSADARAGPRREGHDRRGHRSTATVPFLDVDARTEVTVAAQGTPAAVGAGHLVSARLRTWSTWSPRMTVQHQLADQPTCDHCAGPGFMRPPGRRGHRDPIDHWDAPIWRYARTDQAIQPGSISSGNAVIQ